MRFLLVILALIYHYYSRTGTLYCCKTVRHKVEEFSPLCRSEAVFRHNRRDGLYVAFVSDTCLRQNGR